MSERELSTADAPARFVLRNPNRLWVPLITFAAVVVMFAPPIALGFRANGASASTIAGTVVFALSAASLIRSASRAPVSLRIDGDALLIGRPRRVDRFGGDRVRRWTFSLPDGPPSRAAPASNALLIVTFDEGTTFRGEITSDESRIVAAWFARNRHA